MAIPIMNLLLWFIIRFMDHLSKAISSKVTLVQSTSVLNTLGHMKIIFAIIPAIMENAEGLLSTRAQKHA